MKPDASGLTGLYGRSHQLCNNAAESIVALLACLDRFGLLAQSSSDVLHMLSHAALVSVQPFNWRRHAFADIPIAAYQFHG